MVRVTAFYRWRDGATFDHEYYVARHMTLARELLGPHGLRRLESDRAISTPTKPGDLIAATHAYFDTVPEAQNALVAVGKPLLEDLPHYSTLVPEIAVSIVTSHLDLARHM
jgi:uncharacterized protein (TIGR02118 family)